MVYRISNNCFKKWVIVDGIVDDFCFGFVVWNYSFYFIFFFYLMQGKYIYENGEYWRSIERRIFFNVCFVIEYSRDGMFYFVQ